MVKLNKLVRDNIPKMIQSQGEHPNVEILSEDRFLFELNRKLDEEIQEYQKSQEMEELADILEVIDAICQVRGYSLNELHQLHKEKRESRGSFSKKFFLISKE